MVDPLTVTKNKQFLKIGKTRLGGVQAEKLCGGIR